MVAAFAEHPEGEQVSPVPFAEEVARVTAATPRPAASLLLLRRGGGHGDRDLELLLVRRSTEARFMPGVWVFPGGTVDDADKGDEEQAHRACAV